MGSDRYVVISTDGHCGASLWDYKPYLGSRFHDEFDTWASSYHDGWSELDFEHDPDNRVGQSSFDAPLNWESRRRLHLMEEQGIVAEVLFPNTAPPFYPSAAISAPAPNDGQEYEHRWAGLQAHNRWLADFCADAPGRRAGVAQLFLNDVEDAVAEIRWAKEAGLKGVLLPAPHALKMVNLYYPTLDPVWAVCEELEIPICIHDVQPTESPAVSGTWASVLAGLFELNFYSRRQIGHLIAAGVFERFPNLKVAATELKDASLIPTWLSALDGQVRTMRDVPPAFLSWVSNAVAGLDHAPSESFASCVYLAGNIDLLASISAGSPNLMFGADLPHSEGTSPYTEIVLRLALPRMSEEERRRFLSERAASVYGFDLTFLQGLADSFGPRRDDVLVEPEPEELPQFGVDTLCMTLRSGGFEPIKVG